MTSSRTWYLAAAFAAAAACKSEPDRAAVCRELGAQTLAIADAMAKQLGGTPMTAAERAELRTKGKELEAECLTWPPEVFACMRPGADPDSPACVAAAARMSGEVAVDIAHAPVGPAVAATASFGEAPVLATYEVALGSDGVAVVLRADGVAAFGPDGATRWTARLDHAKWILARDGVILTGDRAGPAVVALDRATGHEAWRVPIPADPAAAGDDTLVGFAAAGAVVLGDRVLVGLDDGRFLRLEPACPAAAPARPGRRPARPPAPASGPGAPCLVPAFALPAADDETDDLAIGADLVALGGDVVLGESTGIRRLAPDGAITAAIAARDTFGGLAVTTTGKLAASLDDELVLFDLAACGRAPVVLPRKPGRIYDRDEGECATCVAPPPGCVIARADLSDVDAAAPVALPDGAVVVTYDGGVARVGADGKIAWRSQAPLYSPVAVVGDTLYGLGSGVDEDLEEAPAEALALDAATGQLRWHRQLTAKLGFIASSSDVTSAVAGSWLVVGYKGAASWLPLTAP